MRDRPVCFSSVETSIHGRRLDHHFNSIGRRFLCRDIYANPVSPGIDRVVVFNKTRSWIYLGSQTVFRGRRLLPFPQRRAQCTMPIEHPYRAARRDNNMDKQQGRQVYRPAERHGGHGKVYDSADGRSVGGSSEQASSSRKAMASAATPYGFSSPSPYAAAEYFIRPKRQPLLWA